MIMSQIYVVEKDGDDDYRKDDDKSVVLMMIKRDPIVD